MPLRMTLDDTAPEPGKLRRLLRSALLAVAGLVLLLIGLMSISMCGPNRHIYGAFAGALGGTLIAIARDARRVRWFALAGGVLGAEVVVGLMAILHGTGCDDLSVALVAGVFMGLGIGLLVDAVRSNGGPSRPRTAPSPSDTGGEAA